MSPTQTGTRYGGSTANFSKKSLRYGTGKLACICIFYIVLLVLFAFHAVYFTGRSAPAEVDPRALTLRCLFSVFFFSAKPQNYDLHASEGSFKYLRANSWRIPRKHADHSSRLFGAEAQGV